MAMEQPTPQEVEFRRGYVRVHRQLTRQRGQASAYSCVDCGDPAQHWSYNNSGVAETMLAVTAAGRRVPPRYSDDVSQYDPRCQVCHVTFDRDFRRTASAKARDREKWERALSVLEPGSASALTVQAWIDSLYPPLSAE